jgi:Trypsin
VKVFECANPLMTKLRIFQTSLDENSRIDSRIVKEVKVKRFIKHENYTMRRKYDDIALIELKDAVKFNEHIEPVCLQVDGDVHELGRNLSVIEFDISNFETGKHELQLKFQIKTCTFRGETGWVRGGAS